MDESLPPIHPGEVLREDFMKFHNARDLIIERSEPTAFGKKLLDAI